MIETIAAYYRIRLVFAITWRWAAFAAGVAALLWLTGCASIRPLGHDTYSSDALRPIVAADRFCRAHGMLAEPQGYAGHNGEFVFKCVAP